MFDCDKNNTMEILESISYITMGFVPTIALEIGYRMRMKVRGRKGFIVRNVLPPTKSLLPIAFRT